jgi:YVTN family beta-propeller protein
MRSLLIVVSIVLPVRAGAAPLLYVSCEDSGEVAVVDTATATSIATWPAGSRPRGLLVAPDGKHLLVALSGSPKSGPGVEEATSPPPDRASDGIGVFDLASGKRLRILSSGEDPEAFDVTRDGRTLYVSNEETAKASRRVSPNGYL